MIVPVDRSDPSLAYPILAPLLVSRGSVRLAETPLTTHKKTLDSEQSLAELRTLVEHLESGELLLGKSLSILGQDVHLTRECQTSLSQAEQKVQILFERDGEFSEAPFNAEGDEA